MPKKIKSPIGNKLNCKGWHQEAAYRMLQNNLDPEVAENPDDLIVYGGLGKAARNWSSYNKIISSLETLEEDETLLIQSGKPVAIFKTHKHSPRVLCHPMSIRCHVGLQHPLQKQPVQSYFYF